MSHYRIKLPHRLVQIRDVFHTKTGALTVVAIDRGREGYCVVATDPRQPWDMSDEMPLTTLGDLQAAAKQLPLPEAKAAE